MKTKIESMIKSFIQCYIKRNEECYERKDKT